MKNEPSISGRGFVSTEAAAVDIVAAQRFCVLTRQILQDVNRGLNRKDFLDHGLRLLCDFTDSDAIDLRLIERGKLLRCCLERRGAAMLQAQTRPVRYNDAGRMVLGIGEDAGLQGIFDELSLRQLTEPEALLTPGGSLLVTDLAVATGRGPGSDRALLPATVNDDYHSLLGVPFELPGQSPGLVICRTERAHSFTPAAAPFFEEAIRVFATALANRDMQVEMRERVKELSCLNQLARLAARPELALDSILEDCVKILPPGWRYQDIASARIILDDRTFALPDFPESGQRLTAPIVTNGRRRGTVEVAYLKVMPELDEGPFLSEERNLLDTIAGEIGLIIEQRQADKDRRGLQEQLRHADRLATIGQLAAGVAHELNEPLGSILGFAQLVKKDSNLSRQVRQDISRIEAASLHAREVIKKLMLFARQTPPKKHPVNINAVVNEGMYFLESRCVRAGIELSHKLAPDLPEIVADPSQLYQALINLVVNAVQAMPNGGRLIVRTRYDRESVSLLVEDTGIGMDEEVRKKVLLPFFTTKDVNEGTGLGLAVVHGIVTSHGGRIEIRSRVGRGSTFEIKLGRDGSLNGGKGRA